MDGLGNEGGSRTTDQESRTVKRIFTRLAVLGAVCAAVGFASMAGAQGPSGSGAGTPGTAAPAPRAQRICIVNIAKVLRDYNKANMKGHQITVKRQEYVTSVNILREKHAALVAAYTKANLPDEKTKLQADALAVQRQVEDIDRKAQTELTQLSNDTIIAVYQEIKGVIKDIAVTNNLDMVLCYPAATKAEDDNTPQVAQLMLQTPAMIPFYHKNMDITEVVLQTLNQRYPSESPPKSVVPAGGAAPPTPGGTGRP